MLSRLTVYLICLQFLLVHTSASAQIERGARCKPLATEYSFLLTDWRWEDTNTVTFGVWNNALPNSFIKADYVWYRYTLSTNKLETLNDNPFNQPGLTASVLAKVKSIQPGFSGLYENLSISPSKQILVYPYQQGEKYDTWVLNTRTNTEIPLGLDRGYTKVLWSKNEQYALLTVPIYPANVLDPIQLVTLTDALPKVQQLDQLQPLSEMLSVSRNFTVHGISPDGRYVIVKPETMEYVTWIFDLQQQKISTTKFLILGGLEVVWETPTTFIALTNLGAIEYDVESQSLKQLASAEEMGVGTPDLPAVALVIGGNTSLSPDGHYMMATSQQGSRLNIVVCNIF
jgi:hypothetical protein